METGRPTPFLARQLPALGWSDCSSPGKQKGRARLIVLSRFYLWPQRKQKKAQKWM